MRCHAPMNHADPEWTPASAKRPCVICSAHDGCQMRSDDDFACCKRVSSEWPLVTGGWVHRVARRSHARTVEAREPAPRRAPAATTSLVP
jgi:hypothetical protein